MEQYECIEFFGHGDPFFGGAADDRPLGKDGRFLTGCYHRSQVAAFPTRQHAWMAGSNAPNRRKGGVLSAGVYVPCN